MDNTTAPIASQMADQYKPDATGEALRNLKKRVGEFKGYHSLMITCLYQLMVMGCNLVHAS